MATEMASEFGLTNQNASLLFNINVAGPHNFHVAPDPVNLHLVRPASGTRNYAAQVPVLSLLCCFKCFFDEALKLP
jgi:hypothetical protein